jgi:hypothetical protein
MLMLLSSVARADDPTFEALGQAPVVGGDRVRARDRAFDVAAQQAVEQAAATLFDPDQLVARTSELKLRIYPRARQYLSNYRVLEEGDDNGLFQIRISAQVSTVKMARDLAATVPHGPGGKPKAMVCAAVTAAGGEPGSWIPVATTPPVAEARAAAEKALRGLIDARNVDIVGGACADPIAEAKAAGATGALYAIVDVRGGGAVRGADLVAAHAKVEARLADPDGKIAARGNSERDAYDLQPAGAAARAVEQAVAEAAISLGASVTTRFAPSASQGGVIVRVTGLSRYADYQALLRVMSSLPGSTGAEPRRFARGEAELLWRTPTPANSLKAPLERMAAPAGLRLIAKPDGDAALDVQITTGVPVEPPG